MSRLRAFIGFGVLVISACTLLGSAGGAQPVHGPNLWAGSWTTSTGRLAFRLLDKEEVANAKGEARHRELYDRLPCRGPQYYRGGYFSDRDAGKVLGCGTPERLSGRYVSNNNPKNAGSFSIKITTRTPLAFAGSYTPDPPPGKRAKSSRWTGSWQADFAGDGCCALAVVVSSPTITLLQPEQLKANPASGTTFTFEIRRPREVAWHRLARGTDDTHRFMARIPGHYLVRVTVSSKGRREVSPPQKLEVRFPAYSAIVVDPDVRRFANAAWQRTLRATTASGVREEGFWILFDTCKGRYLQTTPIEGTVFVPAPPPAEQPGVRLGPRPADTTGAFPSGCATYTVAQFHTHPGTAFSRYAKGVGPSPEDDSIAVRRDVPGIVYDYIESPPGSGEIPDHYPLASPARLYHAGQDRRSTPP